MRQRAKGKLRKLFPNVPVAATAALALMVFFSSPVWGAQSDVITYQGTLTAPGGSPPPNNQYAMRFTLFDTASGGAQQWREAHENAHSVQVTSGVFAVQLGSITPFPANLFKTHPQLWLEVEADLNGDGYETSEKFLPRTPLTATPYAFQANNAQLLEGRPASDFALAGAAPRPRQFDAIVAPSGGDYTTIAAALDAGHTSIFVRNGHYLQTDEAPINIVTSGTVIIGESRDGVLIDGQETGHGISARGGGLSYNIGFISVANNSTLVTGFGTTWIDSETTGGLIELFGSWRRIESIDNNTELTLAEPYLGRPLILNTYRIASLLGDIHLENLTVVNCDTPSTGGIELVYALDAVVRNCATLHNSGSGLYLNQVFNSKFEGNIHRSNRRRGVALFFSANNTFSGLSCRNNLESGIFISNSSRNVLMGNSCVGNALAGIYLQAAANNILQGNSCETNNKGIHLYNASQHNTLSANSCFRNTQHGIYLALNCVENAINGNSCYLNGLDGCQLSSGSSVNALIGNTFTDNGAYGVRIADVNSAFNIVGMNMLTNNFLAPGLDNFLVTLQRATNYPQF